MGVAREAVVEQPHVLVQHRVPAELVAEVVELRLRSAARRRSAGSATSMKSQFSASCSIG